jgi:GMP synthase (glutamine-hydrolysing)
VPLLGVCLGAQLIARAAGAPVGPSREPEVGWFEVELTPAARNDRLFGSLPPRFDAFQWHFYTYDLPGGAVELARSAACTQAFRLGDSAWGIQFHAEVTLPQVESWLEHLDEREEPADPPAGLAELTRTRIEGWNELGRALCGSFVDVAERVAVAA